MATMASHHLLVLLLLLPAVVGSTAAAATAPTPSAQPPTSPLVQSTCKATTYYDLCVSALVADPSSSTADLRGLCAIAVSAAAANAAAAQAALANATGGSSGGSSALLRACAGKYGEARDALVEAWKSVVGAEAYDYAFVGVSAAAEYPDVCRRMFRRGRMALPADLAEMGVTLERLCTVARDIIRLLL